MRILYATDGSEGSLAGARFLACLPLETDCRLTLLTVAQWAGEDRGAGSRDEEALEPARAALLHTTAALETAVRRGHPAEEILRAAEERSTDLVVVGSRGRSALARFLLGSVAEQVARHAPCPVLLARPGTAEAGRVLLGIDDSEESARAAAWLAAFPLPPEWAVRLVTVLPPYEIGAGSPPAYLVPPPDLYAVREEADAAARARLESLAEPLRAAGVAVSTAVRAGVPAPELLQAAEEWGAGLLVAGARGRGALARFLLGSVSEKILRHACCSVLVVRRPAAAGPHTP